MDSRNTLWRVRFPILTKPVSPLLLLLGAIILTGCSTSTKQDRASAGTDPNTGCRALIAEVEGIDTQIRLHINAVHEARWRAQAFGRTSQLALETAEKHKAAVIELRGKRQELYSLYTFEKSNCPILYMPEDSSDAYDAEGEKYKASRDPSRPEGYSLVVK